ncbi:F0F1 ATP synthase subunit gamma [Lactobacillus sp. S2-2]|uniref:F0F1 ATP synthase subunit gamma n=1 Tax=Lactobacillus sp. S2-2 TaxID=2692917 RepID=UPI001F0076CB|nr:F0F1 ATP synthase subunit gamma [Lactobacillus sp. S2-2]MCF6515769.1 F0F1 ATP synthase subunit gamma [Lactobacillus sp. S2-2]
MAESINDIKHRISSTKKTRQITQAMEMVSTVKLNQIQRHSITYNKYVSRVKSVVMHLAQSHMLDGYNSSSNDNSSEKSSKTAYLVITSDRGMVGSYNSNVLRETNKFISEHSKDSNDYMVISIGNNGSEFFKKRGTNVIYENNGISDVPTFNEVKDIVKNITSMFNDGIFSELYVCYSHFVNRVSSEFRSEKLLPMDKNSIQESIDENQAGSEVEVKPLSADYDVEPSEEEVLNVVLPQYAESLVYGAILDAKTSEHASSSTAMKSATDNAGDLISGLELKFNRARQAAITTEITEITGGQEALGQ